MQRYIRVAVLPMEKHSFRYSLGVGYCYTFAIVFSLHHYPAVYHFAPFYLLKAWNRPTQLMQCSLNLNLVPRSYRLTVTGCRRSGYETLNL